MVNRIFHISDIHIRLYKRFNQYQKVLQTTLEFLKNNSTKNDICILTGDIFHNKTQMSPQSIYLGTKYLQSISQILPTIVIAGNHDANLNNKSRMDAITSIFDSVKHDNIHYYKESGFYQYDNLNFYVCSVFDYQLKDGYSIRKEYNLTIEDTLICLYHGTIQNAMIQDRPLLTGKFSVNDFGGYDYVILGDIHQHQIMSVYEKVGDKINPLISYAGSFIQNNFGQSYQNHGVLVWDLQEKTCKLTQIKNQYGYHNIFVTTNYKSDISNLSSFPKIKIKYTDDCFQQMMQIVRMLYKKYKIQQLVKINITTAKSVQNIFQQINIQNIQDPNTQYDLVLQYIKNQGLQVTQENLQYIRLFIYTYNSKISQVSKSNNASWKLKYLKFKNMFNYQDGNYIDFSKFNGLYGLIGPNASGKSSIIDVILFCLFDKTSRAFKSHDIVNKYKDDFECELGFYINDKQYIIKKSGQRLNNGFVPVKVEFYTFDQQGSKLILSGKDRQQSCNIIQKYTGTYEDSIFSAFSIQFDNLGFINLNQANRKMFLNRILKLELFQQLYKLSNADYKQKKSILSSLSLQDLQKQKNQLVESTKTNNSLVENYQNKILQLQAKIKTFQQLKETLIIKQIVGTTITNLQQTQKQITLLNKQINENNQLIKQLKEDIITLTQLQQKKQKKITTLDKKKLQLESMDEENTINKNLLNNLQKLQLQKESSSKKIKLLQKVQYDPNCKFCMNNQLTKDAVKAKENYNLLLSKIKQINTTLISRLDIINKYNQLSKQIQQLPSLNLQIEKIKNKIKTKNIDLTKIQTEVTQNNLKIKQLNKQIDNYKKQQQVIQNNKLIKTKLQNTTKQINECNKVLNQLNNNITDCKSEMKLNNYKSDVNKQQLEKYKKISQQMANLQLYSTIMSKDGLQYYLISKHINILQQQVNHVLELICNFKIKFKLDGKNIDILVHKHSTPNVFWDVTTCSGFQKFVTSIAIRLAVTKVCKTMKPRFLIIDEGFGNIDNENLINIQDVFTFLKQKYQFIIIVSHVTFLRSIIDKQIIINVGEDGFSSVNTQEV